MAMSDNKTSFLNASSLVLYRPNFNLFLIATYQDVVFR